MTAAAFGLGGTPAEGKFTDAGDVAFHLSDHVGHTVGVLFAIVLLDASLIGANVVALSTTYALGDALGKPHSLHWKVTEAPLFYGIYAALLAVSAAVAFSPDHVLGIITQGVQALAGVLLPSATVFLVLLCNDRPVMGPWVNTFRQNAIAWMIVWSLIVLSLMLTAVWFPRFLGDFRTRFDHASLEKGSSRWQRTGSTPSSCVNARCGCIGNLIPSR